ncbi:hypothetical protein BJ741DRAFT_619572 [Chytriomyces cf. hyalinus JEL632]|nr:hypothetical protein BJ741DRAFT_619572 [Chytriomyces cf. hyalinus JEL632]
MNRYRKLLGMDPRPNIAAFETKAPYNSMSVQTSRVSLGSMPIEILDMILCYVDTHSILKLCHALPYYKHISHAMHSVARLFPTHFFSPLKLWPDFELPLAGHEPGQVHWYDGAFIMTEIPSSALDAIRVYGQIVCKYVGTVSVLLVSDVVINNVLGALPTDITLLRKPVEFGPVEKFDVILELLVKENKIVRELYYPVTPEYFYDADLVNWSLPCLQSCQFRRSSSWSRCPKV